MFLKDINPGSEGSNPKSFIIYKDLLYFVADNGINGPAVWRTDGTEIGTELFFANANSSSSPQSFIIAKNGWMYYNIGSIIYRTDGIINEEIYTGASIGFIYSEGSRNYCKYKNGIAFVIKNNDDSFSLIHIDDKEAIELAKTQKTSFFADAFGIAPLSVGLMFSISDSNEDDAIYIYNETNNSLDQYPIEGELIPSRRTINLNDELNICWIAQKGYYSINGISGEEELLFSSDNFSATQGDTIIYVKYRDKLVFVPVDGFWFEDDFLVYTNGTKNGTSNIKDFDNKYLSGMVLYDNYAFLVEGVSNNFQPNIIQINLETGMAEDFYSFEESSTQINSVRPIAIHNDYLYFISNLDDQIGSELYRIKTNLPVNTIEQDNSFNMILRQNGNEFIIELDSYKSININIYNSTGQKVFEKQVYSNQPFTTSLNSGLYFLNYSEGNKSATKSIYIK